MMRDPVEALEREREMREQLEGGLGYGPGLEDRQRDWYGGRPIGPRQTITVAGAALGLTVPPYARTALLTVTTASINFTVEGTLPTTTVGQRVTAGEHVKLTGWDTLIGWLMIRATATSATVDVDYFA